MLKGYGFHQLVSGMIYEPDFFLEVAKGNVPGHSAVNKFGHNDAVAVTGEDVWMGGGIYGFYPTTAQDMEAVSDDPEDGAGGGTGALTMQVYGLDADWNEQSETVTLNGTGVVALENTYIRMYRVIILTAGTNGTNVGNIVVRIASGGTVGAYVAADDGQTQQAIYTIPNGKTGYFVKGYVGISDNDKNGETAGFKWRVRPSNGGNGAWQVKRQVSATNIGSSWFQYQFAVPAGPLPEKTDIRMECFEATAEVGVVGAFDLILVDDGY